MSEIEWLDKVQKNFQEQKQMTVAEAFREIYSNYDWGQILNPPPPIIRRIVAD